MNSVFHSAWEILQSVITWFFPPSLLAEPIIIILLDVTYYVFGMWFLGMLVFKPCYTFARWCFSQFRGR